MAVAAIPPRVGWPCAKKGPPGVARTFAAAKDLKALGPPLRDLPRRARRRLQARLEPNSMADPRLRRRSVKNRSRGLHRSRLEGQLIARRTTAGDPRSRPVQRWPAAPRSRPFQTAILFHAQPELFATPSLCVLVLFLSSVCPGDNRRSSLGARGPRVSAAWSSHKGKRKIDGERTWRTAVS